MPATHHHISFADDARPSLATVLQQVQALAGLLIYYDEERMQLICPRLQLQIAFYEDEAGYTITMGTLKANYLLVKTIKALKQLGGKFEAELPAWAGQSWQQLNKWTYRLRQQRIYYPYPADAIQ